MTKCLPVSTGSGRPEQASVSARRVALRHMCYQCVFAQGSQKIQAAAAKHNQVLKELGLSPYHSEKPNVESKINRLHPDARLRNFDSPLGLMPRHSPGRDNWLESSAKAFETDSARALTLASSSAVIFASVAVLRATASLEPRTAERLNHCHALTAF